MIDDPSRRAVVEELQQAALAMYGEERVAEWRMRGHIDEAATAVWRVGQESLAPQDIEPLPTHD